MRYLLLILISCSFVFIPVSASTTHAQGSTCDGAFFEERNGLVVIEAESLTPAPGWTPANSISGYTGFLYYQWTDENKYSDPGNGLLEYKIRINTPGKYRFQWHTRVIGEEDSTLGNDSWLRFPDADDFYGEKGNSIVYPSGSGKSPNPNGAGKNGWFKIFRSGSVDRWSWRSATSDNDGHNIFVEFDSAGVYTMQVSGRSNGHGIDRMVLWDVSRLNEDQATNLGQPQTSCIVDEKDTIGVFYPSTGDWYLQNSNGKGAPLSVFTYGSGGIPVAGDWNDDGTDTIGVFYRSTGQWLLRNTNSGGQPDLAFTYGKGGVPVVGDWDGNGTDTVGVFYPGTGVWYLRNQNSQGGPSITPFTYGKGGVPVSGDWNDDGIDTIGVYYVADGKWYLRDANSPGGPTVPVFTYGKGAVPVTSDWNDNGVDTIAAFYTANGGWYMRDQNSAGAPSLAVFTYGKGGVPVTGDWNGNGSMPLSLAGIAGFSLVDAETGQFITAIEDGAALTDLPENVLLVAEAFGGDTVVFDYQGVNDFAIDSEAPFTLTGENPTAFASGAHTLTAALSNEGAVVDTLTITFTIE